MMIQGITLDLEKKQNSGSTTNALKHQCTGKHGLVSVVSKLKLKFKNYFNRGKEMEGNEKDPTTLHTSSFTPMVNLRLLGINHVNLQGNFNKMPSEIRWLQWKGCPLEVFPPNTCLQKLGVLDLSESRITKISKWTQLKTLSEEEVCLNPPTFYLLKQAIVQVIIINCYDDNKNALC